MRVVIFLACTFRLTDQEKKGDCSQSNASATPCRHDCIAYIYQLSLEVADPKTLLLQTTCIFQNSASFMRVI